MSYTVLAEFRAKAHRTRDCGAFLDRHAAASREEPGCLVFDVCQDSANEAVFLLYEVYLDEQAYRAHRATPYYQRFFASAAELLESAGDTLFVSRRLLARRPAISRDEETD